MGPVLIEHFYLNHLFDADWGILKSITVRPLLYGFDQRLQIAVQFLNLLSNQEVLLINQDVDLE